MAAVRKLLQLACDVSRASGPDNEQMQAASAVL